MSKLKIEDSLCIPFHDSNSKAISTAAIYKAFDKYCERLSHAESFRSANRFADHAQMARLITPIIDSADLHRGSFRAGDFSQVRDSADSWKQERVRVKRRQPWKERAVLRARLTRQRRRALSVSAVAL